MHALRVMCSSVIAAAAAIVAAVPASATMAPAMSSHPSSLQRGITAAINGTSPLRPAIPLQPTIKGQRCRDFHANDQAQTEVQACISVMTRPNPGGGPYQDRARLFVKKTTPAGQGSTPEKACIKYIRLYAGTQVLASRVNDCEPARDGRTTFFFTNWTHPARYLKLRSAVFYLCMHFRGGWTACTATKAEFRSGWYRNE
jgi:hypothetical protein